MINYPKNENSRTFDGKIGAKILAIDKTGISRPWGITLNFFLNFNSQTSII